MYSCGFLNGGCQWGLIEGWYVSEAFDFCKIHCGERSADLSYGECAPVLFLHDFQNEQGDEADEEVCSDALRGTDIDRAHVEVGFFDPEAFFDFPAP